MRVPAVLCVAAAMSLTGCDERSSPFVPEREPPALMGSQPAVIDVSGSWIWSREEKLTIPAWVVIDLLEPANPGLTPEGPMTQATCTGSGTLTLVQADATFSGVLTQTAHACVTTGGQGFLDPGWFVPVPVADGNVRGRSLRMLLDGFAVDCSYHAAISEIQAGVAMELNGAGECIIPGHPKSDVPGFDPPPGGVSKTRSWTAVRP